MKYSKLTPGKNIIWESSRMMLPEHKAFLVERREKLGERTKPTLDPQKLEQLSETLNYAFTHQERVNISVFTPLEDKHFKGFVLKLDTQNRRIKVCYAESEYWLKLDDVIEINLD